MILSRSIDDQAKIADILSTQYHVNSLEFETFDLLALVDFAPDAVLIDNTPHSQGSLDLCRRIKESPLGTFTHTFVLHGDDSLEGRMAFYQAGADDVLHHPLHLEEMLAKLSILFRTRNQFESLWTAHSETNRSHDRLKEMFQKQSEELLAARDMTVFVLAKLTESRASGTGKHLERIREYSRILGKELLRRGIFPEINERFLDDLYWGSPLHDIGKICIPDSILLKKGQLTTEEFDIMKKHCNIGANALDQAMQEGGYKSFLAMAIDIARHHHERFDGTGYPCGLAGYDIPLSARIVSVADVFDALTSYRIYKDPIRPDVVKIMIEQDIGYRFDPAIVTVFRDHFDEIMEIYQSRADETLEPVSSFEQQAKNC